MQLRLLDLRLLVEVLRLLLDLLELLQLGLHGLALLLYLLELEVGQRRLHARELSVAQLLLELGLLEALQVEALELRVELLQLQTVVRLQVGQVPQLGELLGQPLLRGVVAATNAVLESAAAELLELRGRGRALLKLLLLLLRLLRVETREERSRQREERGAGGLVERREEVLLRLLLLLLLFLLLLLLLLEGGDGGGGVPGGGGLCGGLLVLLLRRGLLLLLLLGHEGGGLDGGGGGGGGVVGRGGFAGVHAVLVLPEAPVVGLFDGLGVGHVAVGSVLLEFEPAVGDLLHDFGLGAAALLLGLAAARHAAEEGGRAGGGGPLGHVARLHGGGVAREHVLLEGVPFFSHYLLDLVAGEGADEVLQTACEALLSRHLARFVRKRGNGAIDGKDD